MGGVRGVAFVLCVNEEEKKKAIDLGNRGQTLENRPIVIE